MEAQIGSRRKSQELKHGNATRICAKTGPSCISSPELRYRFRNRLPRVWWVSKASFKIESFFLMAFAEKHPLLTQVFLSCVLSPCEKPMKKWSFSPWALLWTLPLRSQPRFVSTGWHIETGAWTCWIEYRSTNKLRLGSFGKVPLQKKRSQIWSICSYKYSSKAFIFWFQKMSSGKSFEAEPQVQRYVLLRYSQPGVYAHSYSV